MHGRASHPGTADPKSSFHELGARQADVSRAERSIFERPVVSDMAKCLRQIYRQLQQDADTRDRHPMATEWFLDNYHVLVDAAAVARESLDSDFYERLPSVRRTSHEGIPRIFVFACELIRATELRIEERELRDCLIAYQEQAPLNVAEIWALPIMLRLILLTVGASTMAKLLPTPPRLEANLLARCPHIDGDEEAIISRVIRALRLLATVNWNEFFDAVSRLEAELHEDPTGVYGKMDFRTRDRYRKVIEELAWRTQCGEIELARRVVAKADGAPVADSRRRHIGYYLVDRGRDDIERAIAFRPSVAERARRAFRSHPTAWYLCCVSVAIAAFMAPPSWLLAQEPPAVAAWVVLSVLALVPASSLGIGSVQWLVTQIFPPSLLPRMDFSKGIAREAKTAVAVPAILDNAKVTRRLCHDLEVRYLANPDPNLSFVLLTDFTDASEKVLPQDEALLALAESQIETLNRRYAGAGRGAFHLLHRERRWSEGEKRWMGWERKRGKLVEFNRWILGARRTSFRWRFGDDRQLQDIRFVITLDADTMLPKGAAHALAGIMAHPLNAAEFDRDTQRVVAGYTVVQPRVEIDPASEESSAFTRIVAGDIGVDPYAHAVSDAYQDLFGSGIYAGKGIYDVAAFTGSFAHNIPPRSVLSHDLLEGVLGRAGFASDVPVYEHFPPDYVAYARRFHRWIRGDWQLIPWLLPLIPVASGGFVRNPLRLFDRWKIFDNLRRSLFFPSLFAFLIVSWMLAPSYLIVWTLLGVLAPAAHLLIGIASGVVGGFRRSNRQGPGTVLGSFTRMDFDRWALSVTFTCHLAVVVFDAIVRTLTRMIITRRRLLEWMTFSSTSTFGRRRSIRKIVWREMWVSMLLAAGTLLLIIVARPAALPYGAPVLLLWIAAPEIARWLSVPMRDPALAALDPRDRARLRQLALRTWHYFEAFVEPGNHWLPPDNFQESPRGEVARRTSPTNIAMMFLATLVACDLGFLGTANFVGRLRNSLEALARLPRYRGHILNWVDTSSLEPLEPRYVSTVDSGNLAGALLTVRQACLEVDQQLFPRHIRWEGLADILALLEQALSGMLARSKIEAPDCLGAIRGVRDRIRLHDRSNLGHVALIEHLRTSACKQLDKLLLDTLNRVHGEVAVVDLEEIETWSRHLKEYVESMHLEVETCLPCLSLLLAPPGTRETHPVSGLGTAWKELLGVAQSPFRLREIGDVSSRLRDALHAWRSHWTDDCPPEVETWTQAFETALDRGIEASAAIRKNLRDVANACGREAERMDFSLLYDPRQDLFHIGYNVSEHRIDAHHYDLIASEARLASFIAIARGVAPASHWFKMSRPTVRRHGATVLLSWTGTMFEYLMPSLLMHSNRHTLFGKSYVAAVEQQISYAKRLDVPWGISESGYYRFDPDLKYQYRAFGVPPLGLKRGLDEDLVIAPYASLLAIGIEPKAVMDNIRRLEDLGAVGRFGLYEALDFTPARVREGRRYEMVRSYMAHHQGMILCALGNYLHFPNLVERFQRDPMVRSAAFLLNERAALAATTQDVPSEPAQLPKAAHRPPPSLQSWVPAADAPLPRLNVLSNGRITTRITEYGGGDLQWCGLSLTRWRPDGTRDHWGYWIYLRDEETGRLGSVTSGPTGDGTPEQAVVFFPHKAEFSRRTDNLFVRTEICVAAGDDVEVRRVEIHNESGRPRRLTVTSYAEVVMADARADEAHPAFEKLFTKARHDPELDLLEFRRRRRSREEQPVVLAHHAFGDDAGSRCVGYETDRGRFLGRGGDAAWPAALTNGGLGGTLGHTLDPILCMQVAVTVEPYGTTAVNFVTGVAESSQRMRESMARYRNDASCRWAFREAMTENRRELAAIGLDPSSVGDVQGLLSDLHYPDNPLRSIGLPLEHVRPAQPALWPFGISGDSPILLLKLRATEDTDLLETLLKAHHLWRTRGQHVDLVIVNYEASTYGSGGGGRIENVITRSHGHDWLSRPGGIFILNADQIAVTDGARLEAAARAVLDSSHGSLAQQLRRSLPGIDHLPRLEATRSPVEEPPEPVRLEGLQYEHDFGGFTADGHEYVVYVEDERRPPAPWSNVLANPTFGSLTTESGGGYTWFLNAGEYRLTPWSNDPVTDPPGESLYLRDEQTVQSWSPLPLPGPSGRYRIHHGAGYTTYVHRRHGLEQETRVFVAPDDSVKIIRLRLTNRADHHRRITATYYAEWVLGSRRSQTQCHVMTEYDAERQAILASCSWNPDFDACVAFLATSHDTHGYTCDRGEFLGRHGRMDAPAALERVGLGHRSGSGLDPCAALQIHLELDPQEAIECHFVLGAGADRDTANALCRKYSNAAEAEDAWRRARAYWDGILGAISVSTPEPAMDLLLNRWLLYQALCSRIFARTGFYQSSGAYGFRDQLQDVMALLQVSPGLAREQILEAARRQFDAGDVLHWWHPPSGKGVRTRCSDDLLWLPYVTGQYVDVTGDAEVLREVIPFLSASALESGEEDRYGAFESSGESATLLEHCRRALQKGLTIGPNGLPLIGAGDWNDAMNRIGTENRGESVWLAWFACFTVSRFLELCEAAGEPCGDDGLRDWVASVYEALDRNAWDGAWYRRAFYDDGTPVGSAASAECQIDSISQSWATLSRAPREDRSRQALESALGRLVREDERIVALLTPPFDAGEHDPGYIQAYPPGVRENGGQYTHAAVWLAWAVAEQGDGDRAERLFRLLNPVLRCADTAAVERYRVEPYVLAADVYSSPQHLGRGGWTWYTGSAAWLWRFGIERLLGLRRSGRELIFDPCIPSKWRGFSARIRAEGSTIHVEVRNPHARCRGVGALETGERIIASNRIALEKVVGRRIVVHIGEAVRARDHA